MNQDLGGVTHIPCKHQRTLYRLPVDVPDLGLGKQPVIVEGGYPNPGWAQAADKGLDFPSEDHHFSQA